MQKVLTRCRLLQKTSQKGTRKKKERDLIYEKNHRLLSRRSGFARIGLQPAAGDKTDIANGHGPVGLGTGWDHYHHLGTDIYARERLHEQYDRRRHEPGVTGPRRRWR